MPTLARKFLMAGRGGLNLTHSEDLEKLLARYGAAEAWLRPAIEAFPPSALRAWCEALGQETFVGSSGRVFPRAMKTSPLLRAWLRRLDAAGVAFHPRHRWTGWDEQHRLSFETPEGKQAIDTSATVLALGGASWPQLGSTGAWAGILAAAGVRIAPLRPANCGFLAPWSEVFRDRFAGAPLKRLGLSFGPHRARGEALVTEAGLEGGAASTPCRRRCARPLRRPARPSCMSTCSPTSPCPSSSGGSRAVAASNRCRTFCARPRACRPPPSGCCTKRRKRVPSGSAP
jgi:uncharacterized flavoprotein (TIGR03862 family)